jgi:hypothetical protein
MKMKVAKVSTLFLFLTKAAKAKFIWQAKQGKSSGLSVAHTPFQALDVNIHNGNDSQAESSYPPELAARLVSSQ